MNLFSLEDRVALVTGHMLHVDGGVAQVLSLPVAVAS
jgi:hypothetical protein